MQMTGALYSATNKRATISIFVNSLAQHDCFSINTDSFPSLCFTKFVSLENSRKLREFVMNAKKAILREPKKNVCVYCVLNDAMVYDVINMSNTFLFTLEL